MGHPVVIHLGVGQIVHPLTRLAFAAQAFSAGVELAGSAATKLFISLEIFEEYCAALSEFGAADE